MAPENTKPVKTFRAGGIEVSVWKNEVQQDGQTIVRHSVKVEKQYKNKEEWQKTDYYFPDELPKLRSLLQKAYDFLMVTESKQPEEPIPV